MTELQMLLRGDEEQVACGEALAATLAPGTCIYLHGEMGSGKTTFTRGVARGLGHRGAVKSPTYTLVEPYEGLRIPLYHFDLYRLGDAEELEYLGVRDYFDAGALVIVEWPERGATHLPAADLHAYLTVENAGAARALRLRAESARGARCLAQFDAAAWQQESLPSSAL